MEFFLDSANLKEIESGLELKIIDGVTTNPTLAAKEKVDYHQSLKKICEIVPGPVSGEVISTDYQGMMDEAHKLADIAPNIVVKIPIIMEGIKAIAQCTSENIKTNVTLCFSASQALLAAKAGATYISPFIGRLDDISHDGMSLIEDIREVYDAQGLETKILAASIRGPHHVIESAKLGAEVATMGLSTLKQLINHPLTDIGLEKFLKDYREAFGG